MSHKTHEEIIRPGKEACYTYRSLDELADDVTAIFKAQGNDYSRRDDWSGHVNGTEAVALARTGWTDREAKALQIAESAVQLMDRNQETLQPVMRYDVAGGVVDVGRYLSGEPECMIDYPLQPVSTSGKVVTLVASVSYSGSVKADTIIRRGEVITALALALSQMGHNSELWADISSNNGSVTTRFRVLVKGAGDAIDPARILFAFAHPAMLRKLGFAMIDNCPGDFKGMSTWSTPIPPREDLPEGTIYLPELRTKQDIPDAHEELKRLLGQIGLLASDS